MPEEVLSNVTLLTNFLCMAFSLWFAIYLLARSQSNRFTFRAVVALLSLAFYYNSAFIQFVNPQAKTEQIRSLSVLIALVSTHDLTYYLLPKRERDRQYWIARIFVLTGILITMLHFSIEPGTNCDPRYHCPLDPSIPNRLIGLFKFIVFAAILMNLWQIHKSSSKMQTRSFYLSLLMGVSTVGLYAVGTVFDLFIPRFITNILLLVSLSALAFAVARAQVFIIRRTTAYDLPVTILTMVLISVIYIFLARQLQLELAEILLLMVLVITTHASYDFVREFLDRIFQREERELRQQMRHRFTEAPGQEGLLHYLRRALAILCHNIQASSGFIATRCQNSFEVIASLHSLAVGTHLPIRDCLLEEPTHPSSAQAIIADWLNPVYADGFQVALIGLGPRKNAVDYGDDELNWLEDMSDEIGWGIRSAKSAAALADDQGSEHGEVEPVFEQTEPIRADSLSVFSVKLDPELIRNVEMGFRNLHDYSHLGRMPLVEILDIQGLDHIERGRLVHARLLEILEKLRPDLPPPSGLLSHEWHSYTILHDAYVQEKPARDIMAKLYISEGTYYRTRRKALRGIARALLEMQASV